MGLAQAEAGAHLLGTSGMMDGQVGVVRRRSTRRAPRHRHPRLRAQVRLRLLRPVPRGGEFVAQGDREGYQQDASRTVADALAEVVLDVGEGADIVMVKPALPYLDVLPAVATPVPVPVAAYQISGEYAMVEAAAERGWLDRDRVIAETLISIKRAGASIDPDLLGRRGRRPAQRADVRAGATYEPRAATSACGLFAVSSPVS